MFSDALLHWLRAVLLACTAAAYPSPAPAAATPAPDSMREALQSVIDNVIATQLFLDDIPGAAVAVVKGGALLYLRGHGYADVAAQTPAQADTSLFGTGSVSKLLTWTAVMQLAGQGRLDLDRDINHYLSGFRIPATWPEPVTLAHLMTHTAGFEERGIGFYAQRPADLLPLETFLAANIPARVYPPGQVTAYSNYGAALAGHVVARVAGMPFEQYIEEHILSPLGMSRSSFRQPLPPALAADLATGYRGSKHLTGYGWYQARPSAALRTTAADMARFMIAHLQHGRLDTTRILDETSAAAMQRRQFSNHPAVSGLTYGFQELRRGGQRILWHPGDTLFFTAALFLIPELDLGLYVAYNRARVPHAPLELLDAVLAQVHPVMRWPVQDPGVDDAGHTDRLTGSYRSTRSNATTLEKILKLFSPVRVREHAPGILHISGLAMIEDALWSKQSPGQYRDMGSEEIVVFREDADTGMTWLFEGNMTVAGYYRLPWYDTLEMHTALFAACGLVFLTALGAWSLQARRGRDGVPPAPTPARLARGLAAALCVVNLIFMAGMFVLIGNMQLLLFGIPPLVRIVLLMPLISATLTLLSAVFAVRAWTNCDWRRAGRVHLALVLATSLVFLGALHYWQLV